MIRKSGAGFPKGHVQTISKSSIAFRPEAIALVATVRCRALRPILVAQSHPVHWIRQSFLVPSERRQVEIVIGRIHHVESAGETGVSVKDASGRVAVEHADAGRLLDTES